MKLKIILITHILFFSIFGSWLYFNREKYIFEFYLKPIPIDPRDFLAGTYIELGFQSQETALKCLTGKIEKDKYYYYVYLKFEPTKEKFRSKDGNEYYFYDVSDCSTKPVYEKNWAKVVFSSSYQTPISLTSTNRFYINEKDSRKNIDTNKIAVKVRLLRDKTIAIKDIIEIQ